jgi:hypothetical protein
MCSTVRSCCIEKLCPAFFCKNSVALLSWRDQVLVKCIQGEAGVPPSNPFHLRYPPRYVPLVAFCLCLLSISVDAPGAFPYLTRNRTGLSSSGVCPSNIPSRIPSSRHPAYCGFQTASILQSTHLFCPLVLPCAVNQNRLHGSY